MQDEISLRFNELKFQPGIRTPPFFSKKKNHLKNIDKGNLIKIVEAVEKLNIVQAFRSKDSDKQKHKKFFNQ